MKTSNKILLGGMLGILALVLSGIIYVGSLLPSDSSQSGTLFNRIKGNGVLAEDIRNTQPFEKIKAGNGLNVRITQGPAQSVKVVADENVLKYIVTEVNDGTLKVYTSKKLRNLRKRDIHVSLDTLNGLYLGSGSRATSEGTINGDFIEIDGSSGARCDLVLNYQSVDIAVSSGAHLNVGGEAQQGKFWGSSGAHLNAGDLKVQQARTDVSSGAHLNLGEVQQLSVDASSGGHVNYKGDPVIENANLSSGGKMNRR